MKIANDYLVLSLSSSSIVECVDQQANDSSMNDDINLSRSQCKNKNDENTSVLETSTRKKRSVPTSENISVGAKKKSTRVK